jgi:hypothetical protein
MSTTVGYVNIFFLNVLKLIVIPSQQVQRLCVLLQKVDLETVNAPVWTENWLLSERGSELIDELDSLNDWAMIRGIKRDAINKKERDVQSLRDRQQEHKQTVLDTGKFGKSCMS